MNISVKVKFRPSSHPDGEGAVCYQVIHERKTRQFVTDYRLLPSEWDEKRNTVRLKADTPHNAYVLSLRQDIRSDVERIMHIARRMDAENTDFSVQDIIDEFQRYATDYTLFNYTERIIARLKKDDKIRTSETYHAALMSFRKFRDNRDLPLDRITPDLMEDYQAWLHTRGVVPNTVSFYARILRAIYNRAVQNEIIPDRNPFRRIYTGVDKTVKRALPITMIKKIRNLDLGSLPDLDYARDMFMMSFYLRGMSFVDMTYLKKTDLKNGCVVYRRRKTGQLLLIAWTSEMQLILDKYPANSSQYLLPIIRNKNVNERSVYRRMGYKINKMLKQVAQMTDIAVPLTLYVARHSWASAAKAKGIPVSVISEGMGHDSELTTRIYLASLDTSAIDNANAVILNALK